MHTDVRPGQEDGQTLLFHWLSLEHTGAHLLQSIQYQRITFVIASLSLFKPFFSGFSYARNPYCRTFQTKMSIFQDGQGTFVSPGIIIFIYLIIYSQNNHNYYASKIFQNNYKNVHYVSVCGFNSCLNIIIKLILYTSLITVFI